MNFFIFSLILIPLVSSFAISFLATPLVIKFSNKFGLIDDPKVHKHIKVLHTKPIPRGGGLAIFLSLLISSVFFLPLDKYLIAILIGAALITIVGLIDDLSHTKPKVTLSPEIRLALQFIAALIPVSAGIGIAYISFPFLGIIDLSNPKIYFEILSDPKSIWILADLFAVFWLVSLMNFLNIGAKGVDGQLSGVAAIAALTIALLSLKFSADITEWPVTILASITTGAFLGFLPWHIYPQKIMPSFSGSNLAGYLLGILSILSTTKVGTLLVVLSIPLIDTIYTLIRRIISGKSPLYGDRKHLHHRLIDFGVKKEYVAYFYWIATLFLGILALSSNSNFKLYTIFAIILFLGVSLIYLSKINKHD